ncbi:uncharacterized protein MELLADRAFT_88775 [Melampsora larici-populina 98AG31]|uniref:Uncharacterized protein n=1 Tax=Melampsora larici-populina (strain 98AG31 / pathotype 3-4-7) TaxID=747676 RepID=F4RSY4_MELLP|nr:uncharacterized protein MELLADRAFT_88775 [Melampsora larici-populina 98AG31]EGG04523.1 hypothetical protein MELLADRAFT_88775 [Melampsora larici-populina 98AG31]
MSRTESQQLSHPCRVIYCGEAGEEGPAPKPANKGFLSHHAAILPSGMNEGDEFANPLYLTSYGSQADSLTPGSLYGMTCKMIGTNDKNPDHLHFENANRINFGVVEQLGINVTSEMMDKVQIIALGIIVGKDIIKDPAYKGKPTVVATIKHTDYDPFTRMSISWCTKHYIPPVRNMERAQSLCVIGREAQFTRVIKDYNTEKHMWESEVNAISVTLGHLTEGPLTPTKAMGRPTGGRIPLSVRSKAAKVVNKEESRPDPYDGEPHHEAENDTLDQSGSVPSSSAPLASDSAKLATPSNKRPRCEL